MQFFFTKSLIFTRSEAPQHTIGSSETSDASMMISDMFTATPMLDQIKNLVALAPPKTVQKMLAPLISLSLTQSGSKIVGANIS